jgi:uncharacterized protein YdaT
MTARERGRSNRRESAHTPRCVAIEEINSFNTKERKSFNATKIERASKPERKKESFNIKKRKKAMAREREKFDRGERESNG